MSDVPIGVDAKTVAILSLPGDLWVRSNELHWEYMTHSDGRVSIPRQPNDRAPSRSRRLVGPFRRVSTVDEVAQKIAAQALTSGREQPHG